ncbi:MAG: RluA family pseudouridine synthase [Bacilli bacterium]
MDQKFLKFEGDQSIRLDKFLASELEDMTRNQVQTLIEGGNVIVNGNIIKASYHLKLNDVIEVNIPDPVMDDILPENIRLDIYYEDQDIIVINKPAGMVVHPAPGNYHGTLVNALLFHCQDLSGIGGVLRAGIVHRIDKDTSGLIVACKNDLSHRLLSLQFMNKEVTRIYYALVHGVIKHNLGKIDAPISRSHLNRQMMAVLEDGKKAVTNFRVLERYQNNSLVELSLETGRTHQIRVHMKYIGFPLVGDPTYGIKNDEDVHGQFLHAKTLGFIHPTKNEYMEWDSPLPDYFLEKIASLKK